MNRAVSRDPVTMIALVLLAGLVGSILLAADPKTRVRPAKVIMFHVASTYVGETQGRALGVDADPLHESSLGRLRITTEWQGINDPARLVQDVAEDLPGIWADLAEGQRKEVRREIERFTKEAAEKCWRDGETQPLYEESPEGIGDSGLPEPNSVRRLDEGCLEVLAQEATVRLETAWKDGSNPAR